MVNKYFNKYVHDLLMLCEHHNLPCRGGLFDNEDVLEKFSMMYKTAIETDHDHREAKKVADLANKFHDGEMSKAEYMGHLEDILLKFPAS